MTEHNRRARKKESTRRNIVATAVELFEKRSFADVTMEQIAAQCDITKATLYKYFPVKESILVAQWQEVVRDSKEKIKKIIADNSDSKTRLQALMLHSMKQIMKHRDLYRVYISYRLQHLYNPELVDRIRSGIAEDIIDIIHIGQTEGEIRNDLPVEILVGNFELLHVMQSITWLYQPNNFSATKSSKMLLELFFNGAKANP